jgi:hypothetical protein
MANISFRIKTQRDSSLKEAIKMVEILERGAYTIAKKCRDYLGITSKKEKLRWIISDNNEVFVEGNNGKRLQVKKCLEDLTTGKEYVIFTTVP